MDDDGRITVVLFDKFGDFVFFEIMYFQCDGFTRKPPFNTRSNCGVSMRALLSIEWLDANIELGCIEWQQYLAERPTFHSNLSEYVPKTECVQRL